uniref:Uncharacterized protein LOC111124720 isoform X2 n=1 Tax=Crassostrea virginica TaxID=6565 RepID=A0A8B8D9I1_CRAVI|nr:uncharacterized protein LOC111124720 isoform X2 [Crassostrea virginica]
MSISGDESCCSTSTSSTASGVKQRSHDDGDGCIAVHKNVSKWTQLDLDNLGIHYDKSSVPISRLVDFAKETGWKRSLYTVPQTHECLLTFEKIMEECFTVFIPFDDFKRHMPRQNVVEYFQYINDNRENFAEEMKKTEKEMNLSENDKRLFSMLQFKIQDYFSSLGRFVIARGDGPVPEILYTQLFMDFSRIFFLSPQLGESKRIRMKIGNQEVVCIPDLRFEQFPGPQLITLLSMLTELIFTYLELSEDHIDLIQKGQSFDEKSASIHYTRPFDYWNPEDRKEICSTLFWLGHVQTYTERQWGLQNKSLITPFQSMKT